MRKVWSLRAGLVFVMVCLLAGWMARVEARQARQSGDTVQVNSNEIGGMVISSKSPEAGVWVIAETTDLPTKFVKIVVTDDQGRYLLPELPKATYQVWVRGYGLVDSEAVQAAPGKLLNLASGARQAAQSHSGDCADRERCREILSGCVLAFSHQGAG